MKNSNMSLSLRDFLYLLFQYRITLLVFTFSAVFISIFYSYVFLPKYEATSKVLIKIGTENVFTGTDINKPSSMITTMTPTEIIHSEIELLQGRHIAEGIVNTIGEEVLFNQQDIPKSKRGKMKYYIKNALIGIFDFIDKLFSKVGLKKRLSSREKAVLFIEKGLSARAIKNSTSVKVSFQSSDPDLAAKIVNKAVSLYIDHRMDVYRSSNALEFFSNQTRDFEKKLKDSERILNEFKDGWNISSLEEQRKHLLKLNADIRSEMDKTDVELAGLTERVGRIRGILMEKKLSYAEEDITNPSQVLDNLKLKLMNLKLKKIDLSLKYSEDSPFFTAVNQEIDDIGRELKREEVKNAVTVDIDSLLSKREKLQRLLDKSSEELIKLNRLDYELGGLIRTFKQNEDLYNIYFEKTEEMRILQAMDIANITNVRVMEPAYPPILPIRTIPFVPQKIFNIIMAFIVGIFLSTSFIAFIEVFYQNELPEKL